MLDLHPRLRTLCLFAPSVAWAFGVLGAQPIVPEMRRIPAGAFLMGTDAGAEWERPVHQVEVGAFWISSRPVSVRAFERYRPKHENPRDGGPDAPVLAVSWDDANSYCRWLSEATGVAFRLATEAEWERAARGDLKQQRHPWGAEPSHEPMRNSFGLHFRPNAPWEWVADWFAKAYFQESPKRNPAGPADGKFRVLRGGGYPDQPAVPAVANRGSARPAMRSDRISFRVVTETKPPQASEPITLTKAAPVDPPPALKPVINTTSAPAPRRAEPPAPPATAGPPTLTAVEFVAAPSPSIKLRLSSNAPCQGFPLREPDRYVLDCTGVTSVTGSGAKVVNHQLVKQIRWSQYKIEPKIARAVVDLTAPASVTVVPVADGVELRLSQ